jgi:hypothetical protein
MIKVYRHCVLCEAKETVTITETKCVRFDVRYEAEERIPASSTKRSHVAASRHVEMALDFLPRIKKRPIKPAK